MMPLLQGGEASAWRRRLFATLAVAMMVGAAQWYINYRTRPPEPKIAFPQDLQHLQP